MTRLKRAVVSGGFLGFSPVAPGTAARCSSRTAPRMVVVPWANAVFGENTHKTAIIMKTL